MKEELESFLIKRFNKDINIAKERIEQADSNVKDLIDVEEYQRLTCSFRPKLITNSSDLAKEYEELVGHSSGSISRSAKLQHFRYSKLTKLEEDISSLHNKASL
mgnify:CR=1 FL=1